MANLLKGLWSDLLTTFSAGSRRLKVEEGSTSLALGRSFRAFKEFNLSQGEVSTLKIEIPINIKLSILIVNIESGGVRYEALLGATENTPFNTSIQIYPLNNRTDKPDTYASQAIASTGGTVSGGVMVDLAVIKTGTNNQRVSLTEGAQTERGLPPSVYHLTFTATTNNAKGVVYASWDEL